MAASAKARNARTRCELSGTSTSLSARSSWNPCSSPSLTVRPGDTGDLVAVPRTS